MEGAKSEHFVDCQRNMFGSDVINIELIDDNIIFCGPMFAMKEKQSTVCKLLEIPTEVIFGVEFIEKKKQTNNWFEKLFSNKEEWIRIYY